MKLIFLSLFLAVVTSAAAEIYGTGNATVPVVAVSASGVVTQNFSLTLVLNNGLVVQSNLVVIDAAGSNYISGATTNNGTLRVGNGVLATTNLTMPGAGVMTVQSGLFGFTVGLQTAGNIVPFNNALSLGSSAGNWRQTWSSNYAMIDAVIWPTNLFPVGSATKSNALQFIYKGRPILAATNYAAGGWMFWAASNDTWQATTP